MNFLLRIYNFFCMFILGLFISLIFFVFGVYASSSNKYIIKISSDMKSIVGGISLATCYSSEIDCIIPELSIYVVDKETAFMLQNAGFTDYVEEDCPIYLAEDSNSNYLYNDTDYSKQDWYFKLLGINDAKKMIGTGKGVRLALIDSGIYKHSDLNISNIEKGYNYVLNNDDTNDLDNHGTGVFGLIGANQNNNNGIVGIAPDVTVVPLVVVREKVGTLKNIVNAIYDAVNIYHCDVINISVTSEKKDLLQHVIDYAVSKNVIIVAAAGNSGNSKLYYPAANENVISVGSINSNLLRSYFSQFNKFVDICAPGSNITVLKNDNSCGTNSGTSFSSPIVAGFAVLMKEKYPNISYNEFLDILKAGSFDLGKSGYDEYFGYGCINMIESFFAYSNKNEFFISPLKCEGFNFEYFPLKIYGENQNEALLITAIYNSDGKMHYYSTEKFLVDENKIFCRNIKNDLEMGQYIKFFVINNFDNFKSLSDERTFY